jgi:hypothetical protein
MEMFENIDYLQEIRCNGIIWRWKPAVFNLRGVPRCKFHCSSWKEAKNTFKKKRWNVCKLSLALYSDETAIPMQIV